MSEKFFLLAVARELRDNVAPALPSGTAKSSLTACQRILMSLAYPKGVEQAGFAADELPAALRATLAGLPARAVTNAEMPPENSAFTAATAHLLQPLADWTDAAAKRPADAAELQKLVAAEGALLDRAEAFYEAFENEIITKQADQSLVLDPKAVEAYLQSRPGEAGLRMTGFRQLAGGRSKQTALVTLENTQNLPQKLIIRRDHPAATITRSVAQEYPLLQVVHRAGVAVPEPIFLETSRTPLGSPFAAMGFLPGHNYATHFSVPPAPELAIAVAQQIARLHAIPVAEFHASFPGAPERDNATQRAEQLQSIRAAWFKFARTPSITVNAALNWLEQNLDCVEGPMAVVHSDLGFHNMLTDGAQFVALLDWETAHIGNPAQDLGYIRPVIEQMIPWPDFMAHYRAAGGHDISERAINFFGIWDTLRVDTQLRHARMLYESGATDDILLGEVGTYYVPRFLHRVSQHLRHALQQS